MTEFHDIGIDIPPGASGEIRLLCPKCDHEHRSHKKTLGVDVERGFWHCFRCGWKGRLGGWCGASVTPIYQKRVAKDGPKKSYAIRSVVNGCQPIDSNALPLLRYLENRLGEVPETLPNVWYHPALPYFDTGSGKKQSTHPAMIAPIRSLEGKLVSLHRTYLTAAGQKARVSSPKKIMAPPVPGSTSGAAIQLYKPTETLILAEGIETALALHIALEEPAWATISAHGLKVVKLPDTVRTVIIGADNDESETGQRAAFYLGRRLEREGREVRIMMPDDPGTDWADVLREGVA